MLVLKYMRTKKKECYHWVYNPVNNTVKISECNRKGNIIKHGKGKVCSVYVYAPDEKQAIKKAQDMIATYIKLNKLDYNLKF